MGTKVVGKTESLEYVKLFKSGMNMAAIALKFKRSENTVNRHLKKHGCRKPRIGRRNISRSDVTEYIRLLDSGLSLDHVAAQFNRTKQVISRHVDAQKYRDREQVRKFNAVWDKERKELRDWIDQEMNDIKSYQT